MSVKARLLSVIETVAPRRRLIYILARVFILILIAAFVFEHGNWTRTETLHGPFPHNSVETAYHVAIATDVPYLAVPSPQLERVGTFDELSAVRMWINGKTWNPPEAPQPSVDQGSFFGIPGLYRTLSFALPPNVANDAATTLTITYAIRLQPFIYRVLLWLVAGLAFLAIYLAYRAGDCAWIRRRAARPEPLIRLMQWMSWIFLASCLFYLGTIVYGLLWGVALPTAAVFRLIPFARSVSGMAPYAPLGVIAFAAVGAGLSWLAWLGLAPAEPVRQFEDLQAHLWRIWGLPALFCLFLFTLSAGWSGYFHPLYQNYMSIGGLVPNSDNGGFFRDTSHLAYFGTWGLMGSRRPMAEAFRELTTVPVDYSYSAALLVQLVLIVAVLYWASVLLARRYGIWAAIGFAGLAFNIAALFLSTTMTEPLGYIWGLVALVFFIQSIWQRSLAHALVGLAALTIAMMIRMGAFFAIPFMVLWIGFGFAKGMAARVRVMTFACAIVIAIIVVNLALQRFYGEPGVDTGGNFAWTACGLSVGQGWQGCNPLYKAQLASLPDERAQSFFLFEQTWRNFVAHPSVLIVQLVKNGIYFLQRVGPFMFSAYGPLFPPETGDSDLLLLPLLVGVFAVLRKTSWLERSFWLATLLSIPLSASIIVLADGWRLLHVSHIFIAAFLALGFAVPRPAEERRTATVMGWRAGTGVVAASLMAFLVFPALAHQMALRERRAHPPIRPPGAHEEIVTGGASMSGFVVIPDGAPRPRDLASLHVSDFVDMVHATKLQRDFGPFLTQVLPRVPFAFVYAGRMDGPNDTNTYIAPLDVLRRKDVWAWRFTTRAGAPDHKRWTILREVVSANPLP